MAKLATSIIRVNPFVSDLSTQSLTRSCLEIALTDVIWTFYTFEDYFVINHRFANNLKENYGFVSGEHYSCKYFAKECFNHEDITKSILAAAIMF